MPVACEVIEEPLGMLDAYAQIPIAFEIHSVFDIHRNDSRPCGISLVERTLSEPYTKNYDALKNEGPTRWAAQWDISHWSLISAFVADQRIGGCVLACDTDGLNMLEGRRDIAVLWDIRIHPGHRQHHIGSRLFTAAIEWSKKRNCRALKIETQNTNVPACRFYASQGCTLDSANSSAYPDLPHEVQLIWRKKL